MKKTINFFSRKDIKDALEKGIPREEEYAFISVSDTLQESFEMNQLFTSHRISNYITETFPDNEAGMSKQAAGRIFQFIRFNHNKNFIVHCFAGVSRSGAIAKFINEYYDAGNWYLEDYKVYNRRVFNQLLAEAGMSLAAYYKELEKHDRSL